MWSQPHPAVGVQASKSLQTEGTLAGLHSSMNVVQFGASAAVWVVLV